MTKYHQGKYTLKNPEKYKGDPTNIIYRSSWEKKLFLWLDSQPNVLKWGSEEQVIPYLSPVDGKIHRYFTDVIAEIKTKSGELKKIIIEVKPEAQTKPPKKPSRMSKRYINEVQTYMVNSAKWEAARAWCDKYNYEFHIITEHHLKI